MVMKERLSNHSEELATEVSSLHESKTRHQGQI